MDCPSSSMKSGPASLANDQNANSASISSTNGRSNVSYDYDHIRNMTLMFFLDRLYTTSKDGKEPRSLHDLSCLFGTKGFTKEMRQIVGASRTGLKKFLSTYPSLFTVEGDKVYLSQIGSESNPAARDYTQEAVDYFKKKLIQYGTALVPIKNLFGYRSQASQEVRHVSGQSSKDFKQFLLENDDVFVIYEDHVVLKSVINEVEASGKSKAAIQKVPEDDVIDPYLTKQFASMVEQSVKKLASPTKTSSSINKRVSTKNNNSNHVINNNNNNENSDADLKEADHQSSGDGEEEISDTEHPVSVADLHKCLKSESDNELFLKMTRTRDDLRVFLRMHPKIFKRCIIADTEYVTLVPEDEKREMDLSSRNRHSSLRRTNTNDSSNLASMSYQDSSLSHDTTMNSINGSKSNFNSHNNYASSNESQKSLSMNGGDDTNGQASNFNSISSSILRDEEDNGLIMDCQPASFSEQNLQQQTTQIDKTNNKSSYSEQHQIIINHREGNPSLPYQNQSAHSNDMPTDRDLTAGSSQPTSLRATAPPFVPASFKVTSSPSSWSTTISTTTSKTAQSSCPLTQSSSNYAPLCNHVEATPAIGQKQCLTKTKSNQSLQGVTSNETQQVPASGCTKERRSIDPRVAVRSYLLQASADNSAKMNSSKLMNQRDPQTENNDTVMRDAKQVIERIIATTDTVAFDCKGFNLGSNGQVTLIQLGFMDYPLNPSLNENNSIAGDTSSNENNGHAMISNKSSIVPKQNKPQVFIFDLVTTPELADCLKPLLESESILKVVHDVRNKSNALYNQSGIMLKHVFDTQVANLVIQQQETGKPAYKSRYISTSKLCEIYGDASLTKYRNLIKLKSRHSSASGSKSSKSRDVKYWCIRPLTECMVYESTVDVYCLIGGVYQSLRDKIKPEYLPLFTQLNQEGILARIRPDEIRNLKKERKIDLEVIDLKRKLYSETNGSIVLSNREIRLLRHVELTDEVRARIQQCRKVAKKLERLDQKAAALLSGENGQEEGSSVRSSISNSGEDATNNSNTFNDSENGNVSIGGQNQNGNQQQNQQQQQSNNGDSNGLEEENDDGHHTNDEMTNLIDSSIFDMLKDTIIESTDILDSMDSDNQSCCHCSCHKEQSNREVNNEIESKLLTITKTTSVSEIGIQCDIIDWDKKL